MGGISDIDIRIQQAASLRDPTFSTSPLDKEITLGHLTDEGLAYRRVPSSGNFQNIRIGGLLYSRSTQASSTTTFAEHIIDDSFTLPAGFMAKDGRIIRVTLNGTWTPTHATTIDHVRLYLGGTKVFEVGRNGSGYDGGASAFYSQLYLTRRAAATNSLHVGGGFFDEWSMDTAAKAANGLFGESGVSVYSITWANQQNFSLRLNPGATPNTNTLKIEQFMIEYI